MKGQLREMIRRIIVPLVFGLVGTAILVGLGTWQVSRLAWKQEILAQISARISQAPVALPQTPDSKTDSYLAVTATGQVLGDPIRVLYGRKEVGAGYRVINAFETDGRRILIDRGFIPVDQQIADLTGQIEVIGNLSWPQEVDSYTPEPDAKTGVWFARDLPAMAEKLGTEPILLVVREQTGKDTVDPLPVDTAGIPNDHLNYAITWFSLALIWMGMTAYFIRRTLTKESK